MTIQMKIGLEGLQALPALHTQACWVEGSPSEDLSNSAELGELNRLTLQYTSLRDLISVTSSAKRGGTPRVKEAHCYDITQVKFKNKLLKQAARAYLLPIGIETTAEVHFFARFWKSFTNNKALAVSIKQYLQSQVQACVSFFKVQASSTFSSAFNRLFQPFKAHFLGFLRVRPNK